MWIAATADRKRGMAWYAMPLGGRGQVACIPFHAMGRENGPVLRRRMAPAWHHSLPRLRRIIKALRNSLSRKALLVGARRVELRTSSLSGTRSNQLSYAPERRKSLKLLDLCQCFE